MKKKVITLIATLAFVLSSAITVMAASETVYFRDTPVYWEYGRTGWLRTTGYSKVQSHQFEHCATANDVWSDWQSPGIVAYAETFAGSGFRAYWNCR